MKNYYSMNTNFYGNTNPEALIKKYGSPLYIYNEEILRQKCSEMKKLINYPLFQVNYSVKANSNLTLLKIIKDEGLKADAISPGEVEVLLEAGYKANEIFYISNNMTDEEIKYIVDKNILISIDSLSQLKRYGKISSNSKIAIRLNPGLGLGHHESVITAGDDTKFGINFSDIPKAIEIADIYDLKIVGINQHLGSLFMDSEIYLKGAEDLLSVASYFPDLEFIDIGGGFGIPYNKQKGEKPLDIEKLGKKLDEILLNWTKITDRKLNILIEPGRYIVGESGVLLGEINTIKENNDKIYIGCDIGFNAFARPVLYDAYHDIEFYRKKDSLEKNHEREVDIVGNICESGDIIAKNRKVILPDEGDLIAIMDTGAYGYSMSSNYNNRLRPAEVLINSEGKDILIRRRDTFLDLMKNFMI